jgi:alpha-ketoglutarate-dependent taurine dioxygenase
LDEELWRLPVGSEIGEELAAEVRRRLQAIGFVVLTGFPVDAEERLVERAYLDFGLRLGAPVSQSRDLDFIGRVEDRGSDIGVPTQRGYQSAAPLPFHCDRADLVGLLCIRAAGAGGKSRLVSSAAVHEILRAESPELLEVLYAPLPNDRRGEERPGEPAWTPMPVFAWSGPDFSARYLRRFIEGSQRHPDAPRLTEAQLAAIEALDAILERPGVSLDMDLRPGDLQLIDNSTTLHARTGFAAAEPGNGAGAGSAAAAGARFLLRLWLATPNSPALPPEYLPLYGATAAGAYRGGVWPDAVEVAELGSPVASLRGLPAALRTTAEAVGK